jgi:hypothetical protein
MLIGRRCCPVMEAFGAGVRSSQKWRVYQHPTACASRRAMHDIMCHMTDGGFKSGHKSGAYSFFLMWKLYVQTLPEMNTMLQQCWRCRSSILWTISFHQIAFCLRRENMHYRLSLLKDSPIAFSVGFPGPNPCLAARFLFHRT